MKLRPYQEKAVAATWEWMTKNNGNPLIVMATGLGKSVVNAELCRQALEFDPDMRIICVTHSTKLVEQNFQKFFALCPNIPAGIYAAKLGKKQHRAQVLFASIQSVYDKPELIGRRALMIIDECQTISRKSESMWGKFISGLKMYCPDMRIAGMSATAYRLDSGNLHEGDGAMFHGIAYEYGILQGMKDGWLARLVPKWTQTRMDVSGVHKRGGEFIESELQAAVDKDEITIKCVDEIIAYGYRKRKTWLVFCTGIKHCEHVAAEIYSRGVGCAVVHGEMTNGEVEAVYTGLKNGSITAVCSVEMMTTGVDIPNIDLIAFMRPSASGGLIVQMAGRGTRLCEGKHDGCLILDFAGNIERHGPIDLIKGRPKSEGSGIPPMKVCPECSTMSMISVMTCPDCGYKFPEPKKEEKLSPNTGNFAVTSDQQVIEMHNVTDVQYLPWKGKNGKPDTLRVNYFDGVLMVASEWVCLMHPHESYPHRKAVAWWNKRAEFNTFNNDLEEAAKHLARHGKYPTWIQTRKEGKFDTVFSYSALISPPVEQQRPPAKEIQSGELDGLFD
jgi:DNA repair protein RadD